MPEVLDRVGRTFVITFISLSFLGCSFVRTKVVVVFFIERVEEDKIRPASILPGYELQAAMLYLSLHMRPVRLLAIVN